MFGLGEALVSGQVNADKYVLTEAQRARLERLGRQIEAHFGEPQDLEWCLVDDEFHFVQARPITTLFPIPDAGAGKHVYLSVGHQQMMTDAMKPLGLSLWQLIAARPMYPAGGRLFVDIIKELNSPMRDLLLDAAGRNDPLIKDALTTLVERGDFIEASSAAAKAVGPTRPVQAELDDDPAIVAELIARSEASVEALKRELQTKRGTELFDLMLEDVQLLKKSLTEPRSFAAIMAGANAATWLNEKLMAWLGEKNPVDSLSQSAPHNVTSEMGLALLDVADVIRPHAAVIAYLQRAKDEGFLQGLLPLEGGRAAHDALRAYLDKYGMRCAGEIDVTRTRWVEAPTTLVPLILGHLKNFEPGEGGRKFEQGRQGAARKEQELLVRLKQLPDGEQKAAETQRMISRLRTFVGYREYPKYGIVSRTLVYKQAMLAEAARLGLRDIFFFTFQELREARQLDEGLIAQRKAEHERDRKLTPPRVLTSDGEIVAGSYRRADLPAGALVGLPVSGGVVDGRARVLSDMGDADLEPGDILVTTFTDPSWTPLFVSIKGLVTEIGGVMTHGAVIAREYGLPAVVGVQGATRLIKDRQRIRVNGTDGYVELIS